MINVINNFLKKLILIFHKKEDANASSNYDELIKKTLGVTIIPPVVGHYYLLPTINELSIHQDDLVVFQKLFYITPPRKNQNEGTNRTIGNGEVALYWLFKYQSNYHKAKNELNPSTGDLKIDLNNVEIKSYPMNIRKIDYGRFASDKVSIKILNVVFGVYSIFSKINLEDIDKKEINSSNFNGSDLLKVFEKFYLVKNSSISINELKHNILLVLNYLGNPKTPQEATRRLLIFLAKNKLSNKPGDKNYVLNILSNGQNKIYYIDLNRLSSLLDEEIINSIEVKQSFISLDLKTLFGR